MPSLRVLLIVDDNPRMRATIRSLVGARSESVYECADGAEAVAMYDAVRPDWVLMDISMPRLDGISAMRQIRAKHAAAKIAVVTDYNDRALRESAMAAGASAYVTKEDLLQILEILPP